MPRPSASPSGRSSDRAARFTIPSGVKVLGGFAGNEVSVAQRNATINITTLSGAIGDRHTTADDSYGVVQMLDASSATLLDGFRIVESNGDGADPSSCPEPLANVVDRDRHVIPDYQLIAQYGREFSRRSAPSQCRPQAFRFSSDVSRSLRHLESAYYFTSASGRS